MSFKPFKPPGLRRPDIAATAGSESHDETTHSAKRRKLSVTRNDVVAYEPQEETGRQTVVDRCRSPLQTLVNPSSPVKHQGPRRYFSIVWRKITAKKNKTWEDDGALAFRGGAITVYDSKGRRLGGSSRDKPLEVEDTISISGKDVQVEAEITYDDFCRIVGRDNNTEIKSGEKSVIMHGKTPEKAAGSQNPVPKMSLQEQMRSQIQKEKAAPKTSLLPSARNAAFRQPLKDSQVLAQTPSQTPIPRHDPNAVGALVFKRPQKAPPGKQIVDVVLDPLISRRLRHHQREGVQFLYECVMGMRDFDGQGCILADDMGLGKTLQTIALIWTLTKQNPIYEGAPVIRKVLIVCPVTLVQNWKKEFRKWLGSDRLGVMSFGDEGSRLSMFDGKNFKVMIVGYERLQKIAEDLTRGAGIDLVICDEGHRLKSLQNKSTKAIETLNTTRRVILSGTPIQNDLKEFFAMVNFVNDGVLGNQKSFSKNYEKPIEKSRQPSATEDDIEKGQDRSDELAQITKPFILRRTADVVKQFLPPKTEYVLFCKPTPDQALVYRSVLETPMFKSALKSSEGALQMITILKKLCNSPALLQPKQGADEETKQTSLETLNEMMPRSLRRHYTNSCASKLRLLYELLHCIQETTDDKVVLVSNYTATLDLMQNMLASLDMSFKRLDGSVPANKRLGMVDEFNRSTPKSCFAFLLSAKAGGVGINLIGGNRLILFDVDWNPATDDQAMARIHREGQKKPCYIYRFLIKGGLEERIWQRQVVKRGLAESIMEGGTGATAAGGKSGKSKSPFSLEELRDLFRLDESDGLKTHDLIGCDCGGHIDGGRRHEDSSRTQVHGIDEVSSPTKSDDEDADEEDEDDRDEDSQDERKQDEEILDDDDPPLRTFTFTQASRVSEYDLEEQERSISTGSSPRKYKKPPIKKEELQELMTYTHIDTAGAAALKGAYLQALTDRIDDTCLMRVLKQGPDVMPGPVAYVFMKKVSADHETSFEE